MTFSMLKKFYLTTKLNEIHFTDRSSATDAFGEEYNLDFSQDLLKLTIIDLRWQFSEEHVNNLQAIWRHTKSPFVFWT